MLQTMTNLSKLEGSWHMSVKICHRMDQNKARRDPRPHSEPVLPIEQTNRPSTELNLMVKSWVWASSYNSPQESIQRCWYRNMFSTRFPNWNCASRHQNIGIYAGDENEVTDHTRHRWMLSGSKLLYTLLGHICSRGQFLCGKFMRTSMLIRKWRTLTLSFFLVYHRPVLKMKNASLSTLVRMYVWNKSLQASSSCSTW